eukprot:779315_1
MSEHKAQIPMAVHYAKPKPQPFDPYDKDHLEDDIAFNDALYSVQHHTRHKGRCKRFTIQTLAMSSRISSLLDIITDCILLYKSSINGVQSLTLALFLSMISPYVLSYSSGIKLFIYRKTFDNLVGFKNIFLILYLLPS